MTNDNHRIVCWLVGYVHCNRAGKLCVGGRSGSAADLQCGHLRDTPLADVEDKPTGRQSTGRKNRATKFRNWFRLRISVRPFDLEIVILVAKLTVAELACRPDDWRPRTLHQNPK